MILLSIYCTVCYCFMIFVILFVPGPKSNFRDWALVLLAPLMVPFALASLAYEIYLKKS